VCTNEYSAQGAKGQVFKSQYIFTTLAASNGIRI